MFYVFYFNEGICYPLDESAAMGTIYNLQCAIEKSINVPIVHQARPLLIFPYLCSNI